VITNWCCARAKEAGVDVSLRSLPEGQHNFILGAGRVPEVDEAIAEISEWLRSKLGLAVSMAELVMSPRIERPANWNEATAGAIRK
jgi:hypothetical protein